MRFYGGATPLVWVEIPEGLRDGMLRKIPTLQAEEALREFSLLTIANSDCDPAYRKAVLEGLAALAANKPLDRRRPDGTYIVKTGPELRRFLQVEGGFKPNEVE